MEELHSKTIFSIGNVDFGFRILITDQGPKIIISQETEDVIGNKMSFNISRESLRILAIQLWEASHEDGPDNDSSEDSAVFDEDKSVLTLEIKDKMIDEDLKSTHFSKFISENISDRVEESVSEGAKDFMEGVGKNISKVEERLNEFTENKEVKDLTEEIQNLFGESGKNQKDE